MPDSLIQHVGHTITCKFKIKKKKNDSNFWSYVFQQVDPKRQLFTYKSEHFCSVFVHRSWRCSNASCWESFLQRALTVNTSYYRASSGPFDTRTPPSPWLVICPTSLLTPWHIHDARVSPAGLVRLLSISLCASQTEVEGQCPTGWLGSITHWPKRIGSMMDARCTGICNQNPSPALNLEQCAPLVCVCVCWSWQTAGSHMCLWAITQCDGVEPTQCWPTRQLFFLYITTFQCRSRQDVLDMWVLLYSSTSVFPQK